MQYPTSPYVLPSPPSPSPSSSKPYRRIKLMVVGEANKGKTSLIYNLTKRGKMTRFKEVAMGYNNQPLATVGVDLGDWEYAPRGKPKVTFMTWDFGGQEEYYATHQCFLSNRSLYLLIWSVKDREAGLYSLGKWLENIEGRAPSSPVLIIGTHSDSLLSHEKVKVLTQLNELFSKLYVDYDRSIYTYPRIEPRCHFINCYDARHMDSLREHIYDYVVKYKAPGVCVHYCNLDSAATDMLLHVRMNKVCRFKVNEERN